MQWELLVGKALLTCYAKVDLSVSVYFINIHKHLIKMNKDKNQIRDVNSLTIGFS